MTASGPSTEDPPTSSALADRQTVAGLSLGEALRGNRNSLGFIRLALAAAVIVDHAFVLGGFGGNPFLEWTHRQSSLGTLAVMGFFSISGYLIVKSGMSGDVVQFFWRRTLRIFPAYWVLLLTTAAIVGPVLWMAGGNHLRGYFSFAGNGPLAFITSNWTLNIGTYGIYDLLQSTTPYGREVGASTLNGSIWTLVYEWNCYLIVAVLMALGILRKARIVVPALAGVFLVLQVVSEIDPGALASLMPFSPDRFMISFGLTFLMGGVLGVYSRRVPYSNWLGVLSGVLLVCSLSLGGFSTIGAIGGTYFVLYLGVRLPRRLQSIGAKNDYSYGVYIYGFLVQQVLAFLGWHQLGYVPYLLLSLTISIGCAWISWHAVEKRALALKGWGPGLGWRYWLQKLHQRPASKGLS